MLLKCLRFFYIFGDLLHPESSYFQFVYLCLHSGKLKTTQKNLETQTTLTPPTDQGLLLATEFFYFHQVFTISLLADKKYHHFRPVLDAYIEELFGATKADQ